MPHPNPTGQNHPRTIAIAMPAQANNEFADVVMISLAGLAASLILIAHFAGSGLLQQMFGP